MAVNEMGKYLRQVVDNPLEEGQFENAIAMLDQLRSPDHTPSTIHVLHLIFIALHPASHPCRLDHTAGLDPVLDSTALLLQSPRKIIKQTKSALVLSPSAVLAAQTLLRSFLLTNGPAALAPALPAYPETKNPEPPKFEAVESPICNQAMGVKSARSVWEILKSGYVNKSMTMFGTPKRHGKQAKGPALSRDASFTVNVNEWESQGEIKPVGDDAWPVLDWLVALFESDAEDTEKSGQLKHSPLLLKQLPPPPINSTTRWDASEPLKVVFYALQQTENRRQRIGLRLFHLLIDLTQTPHLNLPSFTSTVLSQLAASCSSSSSSAYNTQLPSPIPSTPTTPPRTSPGAPSTSVYPGKPLTHQEALTALFTHLSPTPSPSCLAFRMALCRKILAELDGGGSSGGSLEPLPVTSSNPLSVRGNANAVSVNGTTANAPVQPQAGKPRPRPVPRAVAAARKAEQEQADAGASASSSTPAPSSAVNSAPVVVPPTPLASATSTSSSTTVSATPAAPPPPLPPLPPLADIARLLSLRPPSLLPPSQTHLEPNPHPNHTRKPPSRTGGRMSTRRSVTPAPAPAPAPAPTKASRSSLNASGGGTGTGGGGGSMPSLPSHPWTSPPLLLLRVKFELLGAWIGLRGVRREREREHKRERARGGVDGKLEEKEKEEKDEEGDAELGRVIEDVFGGDLGVVSGVEGEKEKEERLFYRDVLRAFAGPPALEQMQK